MAIKATTAVRGTEGAQDTIFNRVQPKLLDRMPEALWPRHYNRPIEETYYHWVKRSVYFHNLRHLVARVIQIHQKDLPEGYGRVNMPYALARKYPNPSAEWGWQWAFTQENRWVIANNSEQGRHHVDESLVQRAMKVAVRKAGIAKHATCQTFRHSFATHLLGDDYDIRTVQGLLDHKDVKATMVYRHVLKKAVRT